MIERGQKKMKRKILTVVLGMILLLGVLSVPAFATSRNSKNEITQEMVQSMVDEKVGTAVSSAVTQMQAEMQAQDENAKEENKSNGVGMIAAAIATGLGCIGAGIAVAVVASSAVGAISENPSLLGKTIIFAGLAEGIAIYGLIIAIMILNKV